MDYFLLFLGFIFSFFLPGYLVIQAFYKDLPTLYKLPLVPLLSVMVSTYQVYFVSLLLGYSRQTIVICIVPFLIWLDVYLVAKFRRYPVAENKPNDWEGVLPSLVTAIFFFLIFFVALYPAIFFKHDNYFVMSGVNWQDTALHHSIIETISQGNFPPQAPYFSGYPLSYYYFVDFHSSMLETLFDGFWPRVLLYDNPFFVAIFSLSVFALSFKVTKNKGLSILSCVLAVMAGNMLFTRFFQDIYNLEHITLENILGLIANGGYTMEFGNLMSLAPMADYFLQNRPMMLGLPAVASVALLVLIGLENMEGKYILLAGIVCGLLFKFQTFAFGTSIILYGLGLLIFGVCKAGKTIPAFLLPVLAVLVIFTILIQDSGRIAGMFLQSFSLGPWNKNRSVVWYIAFYLVNFGFLFLLPILTTIFAVIKGGLPNKEYRYLIFWFLIMFLLPHAVKFTIYAEDMFKFFYFMIIPGAILSSYIVGMMWKSNWSKPLVILIIVMNSFNSGLTLGLSYLNKSAGYSIADYKAGLWIRGNTPKNSLFVSSPRIHSSITEIGGRPRVLSYITWAYNHGFNYGQDNVFSRCEDIKRLYEHGEVKSVADKYGIEYVYLGPEERADHPGSEAILENSDSLQLVYNHEGISIYKIK